MNCVIVIGANRVDHRLEVHLAILIGALPKRLRLAQRKRVPVINELLVGSIVVKVLTNLIKHRRLLVIQLLSGIVKIGLYIGENLLRASCFDRALLSGVRSSRRVLPRRLRSRRRGLSTSPIVATRKDDGQGTHRSNHPESFHRTLLTSNSITFCSGTSSKTAPPTEWKRLSPDACPPVA